MIVQIRRGRVVSLLPLSTWDGMPVEEVPLGALAAEIRRVFGGGAHWELRP